MPRTTYEQALSDARSQPLEELDVSRWDFFEHDVVGEAFARMRREAPVHFCRDSHYGPYWSITRWQDIRDVELDVETFSSEGSITLVRPLPGFRGGFISKDPPVHDDERRVVRPAVSRANLRNLEGTIRERAAALLDGLPVGEEFDWVDRVSIELTTQMLATLFDFPFEERRRLTRWSDVATGSPATGVVESREQLISELTECSDTFQDLWKERASRPPAGDLISMLAHAPATARMNENPQDLLGNVLLLIVGGNDTTRNSISGGVLALNRYPDEFARLRANPGLVPHMVSEIVRWQTPLAYMRRTATRDTELHGQKIREGDALAMWYLSANRDEDVFPTGKS